MEDGYELVDLGFKFRYFGKEYTRVSISSNGYVCLGDNYECGGTTPPSPHDILIGLNIDLDSTVEGSGQIYYKRLDSNSSDFTSAKIYLNLFNPEFEPQQIFMITYDNVFSNDWGLYSNTNSIVLFQIYLSTDAVKSFVTFKFKSCPTDQYYYSSSGLNYKRIDGNLKEWIIDNGLQCSESNVGQAGVWVNDVTTYSKFKLFFIHLKLFLI
jgi:hypothetical protein